MGIGLSGMVSGLDTDTLIKQLMSAERTRVTKVENKITKNEWLTEKWKDLNTKIYSLYTGSLSKMKTQGNYLTKKTASSNEQIVKAKAGASAPIGTHYVTVDAVASSQYVTGGTFASAEKLTSKSKLVDAGVAEGTKVSIACGDKTAELVVTADTTFNDFSDACKSAGLNVNFDENRQCLYISSRQSGTENKFSITTSAANAVSATAKNNIYELANYKGMSADEKADFDKALALVEASDAATITAVLAKDKADMSKDEIALSEAYNRLVDATANNTATTLAKKAVDEDIAKQIKKAVEDGAATTIYGKEFTEDQIKGLKADAERMAKVEHENNTFDAIYKGEGADETLKDVTYADIKKLQEKDAASLTEAEKKTLEAFEAKESEFTTALGTYTEGTGYDTADYASLYDNAFQAYVEDAVDGYNTTADATAAVATKKTEILADTDNTDMAAAKASLAQSIATYAEEQTHFADAGALTAIGLGNIDGSTVASGTGAGGMTVMAASDAKVTVNGAVIESSSNNITVNGLTLDLVSAAPGQTVSIGVTQDTDSVYNMVKDFVKQYNEVLDELNKAYYAESARGYDPLTDEQKDAMSETEVEKWETKIKDSLLRRDNTLGSLINAMRASLDEGVTVDGKSYALSSFGICTTKYTEKGKLHIYGDQDDADGMMYEDKLRAAIEEDPETVMEVLQTISKKLYDTMADKMKATELSSALTFYNDKQLTKELTSYKQELDKEEDRLMDIEDRYYKQFASMETALSKLSSQSSSLMSMLGMGQY